MRINICIFYNDVRVVLYVFVSVSRKFDYGFNWNENLFLFVDYYYIDCNFIYINY